MSTVRVKTLNNHLHMTCTIKDKPLVIIQVITFIAHVQYTTYLVGVPEEACNAKFVNNTCT